jgi:Protein of unknown function (DUF2809)
MFGILIFVTIPLGLLSRARVSMPDLVRTFGGDVLSATCIYFGVAFCLPRWSTLKRTLFAFVICVLIEMQQLVTWHWLVWARDETPLDILLGHGFLWSDIGSYAFGVVLGAVVAVAVQRMTHRGAPQIA